MHSIICEIAMGVTIGVTSLTSLLTLATIQCSTSNLDATVNLSGLISSTCPSSAKQPA